MSRSPRTIQVPGEAPQPDIAVSPEGSGDGAGIGPNDGGEAEALRAQLASLQAENAALKARPATPPAPAAPARQLPGVSLTEKGWVVHPAFGAPRKA